jgi:polysaccharide biosynthesis protein PelE
MIALWKQSVLALSTEIASLSLLDGTTSASKLLAYFALHAVASSLVTAMAWVLLPAHLKKPRWAVLALLFSFDFFIPGLGVLAMLIVLHIATRFPSVVRTERYVDIAEPVFTSSEKEKREQSDVRAGYARRILRDPLQSVDTKLRVLIALQSMRPKVAIPLLQGLLADPSEDIRLLAYSMMDAWEKDITYRLQAAQAQLESGQPAQSKGSKEERKTAQINAHRKLAELYWEQVDSGLARGDLRTFALERAKKHCEKSLTLDARQGGLWLVYSTVLIELKQAAAAERALEVARKAKAPDSYVYPRLARLAFDAGDFEATAKWMRRAGRSGHVPHPVRQCIRYWAGKNLDVKL